MSYKARFNRFYKQEPNKSNTFQEISALSGISLLQLEKRHRDILRHPYTYGYDNLLYTSVGMFARVRVYKYALECKLKGPKK